ncbi:MAG: winged helix-turn-helix domain-containing protein [Clostridiales bacterium]|nr:winged helix-turn-helix domain-containing protein [Clostridiales bacterium]
MSTLLALKPEQGNMQTLTIDEQSCRAYIDGELCELTQQEFSLLQELAQHVDCPVSREQLLRDAWGYACPGETRTVDVHVQRLRRKLGFTCIETIYRFGYRLRAQAV